MQNEIILRFCIWGFEDISHDEISAATGITPTKIYIKGQRKNPNYPAPAKENGWLFQPSKDPHTSFEEQLQVLLGVINNKRSIFGVFCKKYNCEISCGVFIYFENDESVPSIHLDSRYHKILNDLDIAFDVDIYCLPNSETSSSVTAKGDASE